jgi:hypothetical protein
MNDPDEADISVVAERLASELGEDRSYIERHVRAAYAQWDETPVRTFAPIIVERRVREELRSHRSS